MDFFAFLYNTFQYKNLMAEISKNPIWSIMVRFVRFLWLISSFMSHTKIWAGQSSETVGYNPSARMQGNMHSACILGAAKMEQKSNMTNDQYNSNSSWTTWGRCWPSCWYDPNGPIVSCQWLCMSLRPCYMLLSLYCNCIATVLQLYCNCIATALSLHTTTMKGGMVWYD